MRLLSRLSPAVCAIAMVAAPATTGGALLYSVSIQAVFDSAGNPLLVANFSPDGSLATPRWSVCVPPDLHSCRPAKGRQFLEPGPKPAGTVFVATATYGGLSYSARVTWRGRIHSVRRPRLRGRAVVGAAVRPRAGRWSGGWRRDFNQLGVQACRTVRGTRCLTVSGGQEGCPGDGTRPAITARFVGWYLFALDARQPHDLVCAGVAYGSEEAIPPWKVSRTVSRSTPLGPVTRH